jgi:hypothetical protein
VGWGGDAEKMNTHPSSLPTKKKIKEKRYVKNTRKT